jgi:hypothetical protein
MATRETGIPQEPFGALGRATVQADNEYFRQRFPRFRNPAVFANNAADNYTLGLTPA